MPQISIVTACSIADLQFLERLYHSLKKQDLSEWEWLLQIDGVTDSSLDLFLSDSRVLVEYNRAQYGVAITRNRAIFRSCGEVIRNLDADDWLASDDVLSRTTNIFKHDLVQYSAGSLVDVLEDGNTRKFNDSIIGGLITPGTLVDGWLSNDYFGLIHPTSISFRKSLVYKYGPYPALSVSEDSAFILPISEIEWGWFDPTPVAYHSKRSVSITGSLSEFEIQQMSSTRTFITERCKYLRKGREL